jgi:hypothetical protein
MRITRIAGILAALLAVLPSWGGRGGPVLRPHARTRPDTFRLHASRHAARTCRSIEPGSWAVETDLAFQNTWALSPEVEKYLVGLESAGRRELGPEELQAIRELPGETISSTSRRRSTT